MSEMDMWNLLAAFMSGNAVWFLAYIVAIWLGFRMTNNIQMNGNVPLLGKALVSVYCLTVISFMTVLTMNTNQLFGDIAAGLQVAGESGGLSVTAQRFVDEFTGFPSVNPIQIAFLASIILMQLLQTWIYRSAHWPSPGVSSMILLHPLLSAQRQPNKYRNCWRRLM